MDKFADIHLYKVVTEKYTYFIRCFYGMGDYNFYIFAYNNEKMRKYNDSLLVEKYSDVLDKDKFFKTDSGFAMMYITIPTRPQEDSLCITTYPRLYGMRSQTI